MRSFFSSLSFKIGSVLILAEIIILLTVSVVYANRFFDQIDKRIEERVQLPGELVNSSLVRLISIRDADSLRLLVGEDIENAILIDAESLEASFSLDGDYQGESVENIPGLQTAWFNSENPSSTLTRTEEGDGNRFLVDVTPIQDAISNDISAFLYIKTSLSETEAEKSELVSLLIIGSVSTVLATFVIMFLSFRFMIFARLSLMLQTLKRLEQGELGARVDQAKSNDEIGVLQRGVNSMAGRREKAQNALSELNEQLETRVTERTRDLRLASEVSRRITQLLNIDELLSAITQQIREAYSLYHASIFLYDDENKQLQLQSSVGRNGSIMEAGILNLSLDFKGLISNAARDRQIMLINNVEQSDTFMPNPLLPDTQSEMVVPIILGEKLIGVLDLQSELLEHFGEDDKRIFQTLAEQIAIAVENARLYGSQVEVAEELRKVDEMKSQFLASMSHELRTPLNSILTFTELMSTGTFGEVNEEQIEYLSKSLGSGRHLLSLINDILDITKIQSGMMKMFYEDNFDAVKEIDQVVATVRPLLSNKSVELLVEMAGDFKPIECDKRRIRQVLINLLSNAIKFTEEGSITLNAKMENEDTFVFSVADTGPGISEDQLEIIFEPFVQTETGINHAGGTGLGLPISKQLVEAHGGQLTLESKVGKGATFHVSLPIRQEVQAKQLETQTS